MRAIAVNRALCDALTIPDYIDAAGDFRASKEFAVLPFSTSHRGDVLLVTDGVSAGVVEVVSVERVADGYKWQFRNPRRCVDEPIRVRSGRCVNVEFEPCIYPRMMEIGADSWEKMRREFNF